MSLKRYRNIVFFLVCLVLPAFADTPVANTTGTQAVNVLVDGKTVLTLDHTALATLPRTSATAAVHDEKPSQWQGVALEDILKRAGAPTDKQVRGRAMTTLVLVTASDHYQVAFSLGELDPTLGNTQVILADRQDGQPLTKDGPFRLVVPGDKRAARWVRNVITIDIEEGSTLPKH